MIGGILVLLLSSPTAHCSYLKPSLLSLNPQNNKSSQVGMLNLLCPPTQRLTSIYTHTLASFPLVIMKKKLHPLLTFLGSFTLPIFNFSFSELFSNCIYTCSSFYPLNDNYPFQSYILVYQLAHSLSPFQS